MTGSIAWVNTTPPIPSAADWSWAVGRWAPNKPTRELVTTSARSLTINLWDPSTATFTINGDAPEALAVEDLTTDLWVSRNGTNLFRGRCAESIDDIQQTTYNLNVTATDYRGVLDRRLLLDSVDKVYVPQAQELIVADLLTIAQADPGGNLGITHSFPSTGTTRTGVTVKSGDSIWASIRSLMLTPGGFDFMIDQNLKAVLSFPNFGTVKSCILDYGGTVSTASGSTASANFSNVIRYSGGSSAGSSVVPPPVVVRDAGAGMSPAGLWETSLGDTSQTTADQVSQAATHWINYYGARINTAWSLTLAPGAWTGPNLFWIGDIVTYSIKRGRRNITDQGRIYSISISLDQNNNETVSVVIGAIVPTEYQSIKRMAKKLAYLSKF